MSSYVPVLGVSVGVGSSSSRTLKSFSSSPVDSTVIHKRKQVTLFLFSESNVNQGMLTCQCTFNWDMDLSALLLTQNLS